MIDLSQSRRCLPATMLDRSTYSIISVIKQAIGKDLTRFSIPVIWNEPLSFLQRLAECLEYSSLLDQAASTNSSIERMHFITAFIVSGLSTHLERMSKPFNPLLGETYELKKDGMNHFHYISEQVSHHPPISALYARGEYWTLTANIEPKIKFQGTNVVAISEGQWFLRLRKQSSLIRSDSQSSFHSIDENLSINDDDDEYIWTIPTVVIHNILFGHLWCEFQGEINIEHIQTTQRSHLIIKSHSWFASQATKLADTFKYSGFIYENDEKQSAFHGNYGHCYYAIDNLNDFDIKTSEICSVGGHNCIHLHINPLISSACDLLLTASSRLIWHRYFPTITNDELNLRPNYYYFTPFTMCLNEEIFSIQLPPTDCRFRQDIRYLEQGNLDASTDEKHRLEEQQRTDAKQREHHYEPLWFKLNENNQFIYTNKYETRNFDHCPNLFTQT